MSSKLRIRTFSDGFLFLRVFLFAAAVPYLMRLRIARLAAVLEPGTVLISADPNRIRKIGTYLEMAIGRGRPLVRPGCLTLGVTRYYFFRRAGMDVSLHFGMGRIDEGRGFLGHCWLERDGEPFLEARDPRGLYAEMYCISPEGHRKSQQAGAAEMRRQMSYEDR